MKMFKTFFKCYFTLSESFSDLDEVIDDFKGHPEEERLIVDLHQIIQSESYKLAARIMRKYGSRKLNNLDATKNFINFLYDRFTERKTQVQATDFANHHLFILCPICCLFPDFSMKYEKISFIDKATITKTKKHIYICKPCKLVWLSEDIKASNCKNFKKYMRSIGLKGFWNELSDIETL